MTRCLATLGAFDGRGDGWLVELDADSGAVRERLRVEPPPDLRVAGKGLSGATRLPDGRLGVCGAAAIYIIADDGIREVWACPSFNDLHGLTVAGDRVWVANTGLDTVEVLNTSGRFLGSHAFDPPWLTARRLAGETPSRSAWDGLLDTRWTGAPRGFVAERPPVGYYGADDAAPFSRRRIRDRVHPNHVAVVDGRPWVTCLALSAVVDMVDFGVRARFEAPPHDGRQHGDRIWFTRVDGVVEARDVVAPEVVGVRVDVSAISGVVGWCRGLHITDDLLWVGYTEMRRPARFRWQRAPLGETRTAVVCLDRTRNVPLQVFDLSVSGRHTKVGALLGMR